MQAVTKSRKSIQQLSSQLANQIAAGEVVERPASVIKELLENSLDAGATQIDIDIQAGGTQQIRIRDNGHGIPQDELPLALSPHATSKIRSIDDLIQVSSMGFRGEALASIASVSELLLTSCYSEMAWTIKAKEGQFDLLPASHPVGTTVEVNNLFFNTPARRKFLKADRTEYRHIEDVVKRIALSRFDVAINFRHNQRKVFSLPVALSKDNKLKRLTRLVNKEFINAAVELNYENAGLKLSGWIATSDYSRSQSDMQYFFVNGRVIRDKVITHAIKQAYQNTLHPGRFPVYVLQLEMDPEQVDVNVHPTKHEVRFRQGRLIHDFLFYSLREALSHHAKNEGCLKANGEVNALASFNPRSYSDMRSSANSIAENATSYSASSYQNVLNKDDINKPLGIAIAKFSHYLLLQNKEGLLALDLNKARRLLLSRQITLSLSENEKLISKPVLIPFNLNLNIQSDTWLATHGNELIKLGFEFAALGEQNVMVRQVPALLTVSNLKESLQHFVALLTSASTNTDLSDLLTETILTDTFSHSVNEWNNLLRDLETHNLETNKSIYHQLTDNDFARFFET